MPARRHGTGGTGVPRPAAGTRERGQRGDAAAASLNGAQTADFRSLGNGTELHPHTGVTGSGTAAPHPPALLSSPWGCLGSNPKSGRLSPCPSTWGGSDGAPRAHGCSEGEGRERCEGLGTGTAMAPHRSHCCEKQHTGLYGAAQYSSVLYDAVQCCTVPYGAVQCCTVL